MDEEKNTHIQNEEENVGDQKKVLSGDIKYMTLGSTDFEVVSNYTGKTCLMDIVRSAIKRDVESGNF